MDAPAKVLILFIEGEDAPNVERAEKVAEMMGEQCQLQVVDVNEDPDLAEVVGVDSTPTLVRLSPDPRRKVAGDLANHEEVAHYLGAAWTPRTDQERPTPS